MPVPLHPIVVHFPIVLGLAVPLLALIALIRIGAGAKPRAAWTPVLVVVLLTLVFGIFATRSGESEEERVEEFVPHDAMELHEGNGKRFMPLIMITTVLTLAGFAGRRVGGAARGVTLVVALLMAAQLFWAAKTGGALVYEHGAANAYTGELAEPTGEYEDEHDDDD